MKTLNPFLSVLSPFLTLIGAIVLNYFATYVPQGTDNVPLIMNAIIVFCLINPVIGLAFSFFISKKKVKRSLIVINSVVTVLVVPYMIFIAVFRFGFVSFV
ncbi:hypothetical protein [Terribacillus halophilus]|uniref:hypothetical protein n=1 Tax=Terribacillus halophilus TaxID=361279 RepID=UPI000B87230C|nr:hypothetical protein [Terribacillus halophilus]